MRHIQLWMTIGVMVFAPLVFGSVDLFWVTVWVILLSVSAVAGITCPVTTKQGYVLLAFFVLCGAYALVAVVQVTPGLFPQLNDPIWTKAGSVLAVEMQPRISSRAEIPTLAAGHALLFATAFLNGFYVGTSRQDSDKLVQFAQYSILLYAIYGFIALLLTPNMLLWTTKLAYRGSLTATFVNHNTAATFIGTGVILWFGAALSASRSIKPSSFRMLLLSQSNERLILRLVIRSAGALICLFALLQTGSRAGLFCSGIGLLATLILMLGNRWRLKRWQLAGLAVFAMLTTITVLTGMGKIASHGLFDEGRWSVYGFIVQAIGERSLLGAGAGTFADLFPVFRNREFYSWGVWDFAHSTVLEIAFEMGLPIALMVVGGALAALLVLFHAAWTSQGRNRKLLSSIAGVVSLTYLHSLVDFSLQVPGFSIVFGILLGCGLARATSARDMKYRDSEISSSPNRTGVIREVRT